MARTQSLTASFMFLLALLFTPLALALAGGDVGAAAVLLTPRQSPSANDAGAAPVAALDPTNPICMDYAMVANLTTVGLNSTYRAAFQRSAPMGTDAASGIMDGPAARLPAMMADAGLNAQCGNLTAVAIAGAEANLTAGTVLGLPILEAAGVDPGNVAMPIVVVLILLIMGGTWISL
ncbi:hypothetical protein F5X99DRAFT_168968 [Biscogniauxia marginata]|nr:hypothetical protein F5X99DRAFT_168968 [Biscogniauxia marginata]